MCIHGDILNDDSARSQLAHITGASEFLESEVRRLTILADQLKIANRQMRIRLKDFDELMGEIQERLVNAGHRDCEHCMGTGGVAEAYDVPSNDGYEISRTETIGWSAPSEDECVQCHGTGIEFK